MGRWIRIIHKPKNIEREMPVCKLRRRNIYKGNTSPINKNSFLLKGIQPVGYYALRPFWKDGHHSGIYSFEMLRALCENLSGE